jgi:hypothetical protein
MIDNLQLKAGHRADFSYLLRYKQTDTVLIDVLDKKITDEEALS